MAGRDPTPRGSCARCHHVAMTGLAAQLIQRTKAVRSTRGLAAWCCESGPRDSTKLTRTLIGNVKVYTSAETLPSDREVHVRCISPRRYPI